MYEDPHRHIIFYPCSFRFPQENILTHTHSFSNNPYIHHNSISRKNKARKNSDGNGTHQSTPRICSQKYSP